MCEQSTILDIPFMILHKHPCGDYLQRNIKGAIEMCTIHATGNEQSAECVNI